MGGLVEPPFQAIGREWAPEEFILPIENKNNDVFYKYVYFVVDIR